MSSAKELKELEDRIERLEKQLATQAESSGLKKIKLEENSTGKPSVPKTKRTPSAYNNFMKEELARLKAAAPEGTFDRKVAFKQAANAWSAKKTTAPKTDGSFWG